MAPDKRQPRADGERARSRILHALADYHRTEHRPPTFAELGTQLGVVRSTIAHHLRTLERQGLVRIEPGSRGVFLTDAGSAAARR